MSTSTRPSSPALQEVFPHIGQDHEPLSSVPRTHSYSHLADNDMGIFKERSHLDIILDAPYLSLKGTGVDVEPARLTGHVMLFLSEDTPLKEITLQFRGKARIPIPPSESLLTSSAPSITYVVCNHDWSFLEGDKRHTRTLKAGRHVFPFHLQIGGSLPSTIGTSALGGASICYKLRAIAVRPGLSHNLQTIVPVHIDRSFSNEALEYQQTLEIENTWPEKLMYSIVLPHKAWAAGDDLTAILKCSPIAKGVHISDIRISIHETTKIYARTGAQENTRVVASTLYSIIDGKAIPTDARRRLSMSSRRRSNSSQTRNVPVPTSSEAPSAHNSPTSLPSLLHPSSPHHPSPINLAGGSEAEGNNDLIATISIPIPVATITPTHSVEPIVVSHRVRWSILIQNMDGHTSELRCSLPIHILHNRLLDEARSFSATTRRLVLGLTEPPTEGEGDRELPSYAAHVRDRVANMFLPDAAFVRVNNPWINHVGHSQLASDAQESFHSLPTSRARSGFSSPLEPHNFSHLPQAPGPDGFGVLDVLNSELLLSLSDAPFRPDFFTPEPRTPSDQSSFEFSHSPSQGGSQSQSRHNSRPASPDRIHHPPHHNHENATINQGHNHSRNFHSIIRATMKPFTSLGHHHSLFPRHAGHHSHGDHEHHLPPTASHREPNSNASQATGTTSSSEQVTGADLLHRAFTEVPDYSIASRGFLGGVPPLDSMRGLPSYEEAAREATHAVISHGTNSTADVVQVRPGPSDGDNGQGALRERGPSGLERHSSSPVSPVVSSVTRS